MTRRERWRRVDELFRRALELPDREREAFLDRASGDDAEVRALVAELLDADATAGRFLEGSVEECCELPWHRIFEPAERADGSGATSGTDRAGEGIGHYRLVERIGRGGMASVYLAERADGQFEQRVAIKLLRRGLDTDDVVRRFLAERQILSSLSHPNIARVFDGGATRDGLPYIVMEYVEGTPLVAWCDERGATVRERLRLFRHVGRAVHHAHRSLVVHRDLKPSNILVDEDGNVKLLDFGIAKLLAEGGDIHATRTGLRAMTPAYASPELVSGDPITTASDVYQLGLVLCELVTGRLPYDVAALSPARAERLVTEAEPARPSSLVTDEAAAARSASSRELAKAIEGDLDLIVLQSLRREVDMRYPSAEAFVDDIERHLRGEPIRARPDAPGYRMRKFVGRNRVAVAIAALLFLVVLGSAVVASIQAGRLAVERDRAVAHERRAEQVTAFLTGMFRVADPNEGAADSAAAATLLSRGVDRALAELETEPEVQAAVLSAIGDMYLARGLESSAAPLLERAVELRRLTEAPAEELVVDLRRLSSAVYYGDRDRAIALLEEAVGIAEASLGPDHRVVAATLTDLAEKLVTGARAQEARERALAILRDHPGDVRAELASILHLSALGVGLEHWDRLEEALEIRRELFGEDHTTVAATLGDMALVLEPYDAHAADTLLEKAAEVNVRIHGLSHPQTLVILNNLAGRYRDRGDYAQAEPLYRRVLDLRLEHYPDDASGIAYTQHGLGWSLTELGRAEEAEPMLRDVVEVVASAPEQTTLVHQVASSTLGRAIAEQGRYEESEPLLRDSFEWVIANEPHPLFVPFMADRLIELYEDWGKPSLAAEYRARKAEWLEGEPLESAPAAEASSPGS